MKILITGGAGYIGSHTAYKLIKAGHTVTILDNLEKGQQATLDTLRTVAGEFTFIQADLRNFTELSQKLAALTFDTVIHFAAYIEVGRSASEPEQFFENNTMGSLNLFKVLLEKNIAKIVFSSTAAVYKPKNELLKESDELKPESPYGESKLLTERILESLSKFRGLQVIILRYFNPAGAIAGLVGEKHLPETHLIPRLLRSLLSPEFKFTVYGNDYATTDGTCLRDFLHIEDLVDAHLAALKMEKDFAIYNVGTGIGTSVKQVITTAEKVTGQKINYNIVARRSGDADILVADPAKIQEELGWQAKFALEEIIRSAWEYEQIRPEADYQ
ncbi:MAG: UDP-glucose 4-epimerase GalE [bacterium]